MPAFYSFETEKELQIAERISADLKRNERVECMKRVNDEQATSEL